MLETITETIKSVWNKLVETVKSCYNEWQERLQYIQEHDAYLEQILQHDGQYHPSQPDIELLEKIQEYIQENYPNGIEEQVKGLSEEELVEKFRELINDASQLMGVSISEINFYIPESEHQKYTYGYYNRENNSININLAMLLSGEMALVQEQFYTVFHEMKHALQWAAVVNPENYNYPDEQIIEWAENYLYYIPYEESDEGYLKQPIERDTFGLESVLKGEISIESLKQKS